MLPGDPPPQGVIIFQGSRSLCQEFGLVLEARGLPYELLAGDPLWCLSVPADSSARATDELGRYAQERSVRRSEPPATAPFPGGGMGAVGYAGVLMLVAYCAGINLFDVNWYSAGGLEHGAHLGRDWWRALTALTLHVDALHLLGNLFFGVAIGLVVSSMFGPGIAWASILATGAVGNYLEMLVSPAEHRAIGASTAVFGALGLLSGFGWRKTLTRRERWLHRWAPLIAGTCLLALLGTGDESGKDHVDVLGHLLGFLSGVGLGWIYGRADWPQDRGAALQIAAGGAALIAIAIGWVTALYAAA